MCLPVKPFKIENEYIHAGLKCAVVQARENRHRCGYVRLPPTHSMFDKPYDNINVNVHGGLTFARMEDCVEEDGQGYWIGFDCNHCGDASYDPAIELKDEINLRNFPDDHYWSNAEVVRETNYLAEQLARGFIQ